MAPIVASVAATLSAVKMNGSAVGMRNLRNTVKSDAAVERISSSAAGSTELSPRTVLIITGKKTSSAAIIDLDSGLARPNQLFMIGAKAMIGMELRAIAKGSSDSRAPAQR